MTKTVKNGAVIPDAPAIRHLNILKRVSLLSTKFVNSASTS